MRRRLIAVLLVVFAVLVTGCSFDSPKLASGPPVTTGPPVEQTTAGTAPAVTAATTAPTTTGPTIPPPTGDTCTTSATPVAGLITSVATANSGLTSIPIYDADGASTPCYDLPNPDTDFHRPDVFMVLQKTGDWIEVQLPIRPNEATGWIKASDVTTAVTNYRFVVSLSEHDVKLYQGKKVVIDTPAGIGTGDTPTPPGVYYIVALIKPTNSGYGPWAYALSGHSDKLQSFAGGDGRLGLHGTDDPSSIGQNVSHGCIRIPNATIDRIVLLGLPLGVPVTVNA